MRGVDLNKLTEGLNIRLRDSSKKPKENSQNKLSIFIEFALSVAKVEMVRFVFLTPVGTIEGNCTNHSANMDDFVSLSEVDFTNNAGHTVKFEALYLRVADVVALYPICSVSTEELLAWHNSFEASEVAD